MIASKSYLRSKIKALIDISSRLQSQALALTHKASPPSRPSSVSSLPRSPQSHQSQQSQPQNTPQPPSVHPLQSQTPLSAPQTPFSAHNQHPKQEISASPKQEGFDLSKSASSTGKFLFFFFIFIVCIIKC